MMDSWNKLDAFAPQTKMAGTKSFDKTVVATYAMFFVVAFMIWKTFSYTFLSTLDHLLTFAAALQTMALCLLAIKVHTHRSVEGISLKMLVFYAASFTLRLSSTLFFPGYVPEDGTADFWLYQLTEIVGLLTTIWLIHMLVGPLRMMYKEEQDSMPMWAAIPVLSFVLAVLTHSDANSNRIFDITWMMSQWLDSLSMAPQLFMVAKMGRVERWTSHFIFWTVCARLLLGLFWTLLQINHPIDGWFSYGMTAANLVHFIMCADYIYYFVLTFKQQEMVLPKTFIDI